MLQGAGSNLVEAHAAKTRGPAGRRAWKVSHFSRIVMRLGELCATLWYTCGSSSSVSTCARGRAGSRVQSSPCPLAPLAPEHTHRRLSELVCKHPASAAPGSRQVNGQMLQDSGTGGEPGGTSRASLTKGDASYPARVATQPDQAPLQRIDQPMTATGLGRDKSSNTRRAQRGRVSADPTPDVQRLVRQLGLAVARAAPAAREQAQADADRGQRAQLQQQRHLRRSSSVKTAQAASRHTPAHFCLRQQCNTLCCCS